LLSTLISADIRCTRGTEGFAPDLKQNKTKQNKENKQARKEKQ